MKKTKSTYLLSPDLKWGIFKRLWNSVSDSGPTPQELCKVVWELMRDKRLYLMIEDNEFVFSLHYPKGEVKVIENGKV